MEREELINLCEKAVVPQDKWSNRDSALAQAQVAVAATYLKSGCDFEVAEVTENTIWLNIEFQGFQYFESEMIEAETFYIPTRNRLNQVSGDDWY